MRLEDKPIVMERLQETCQALRDLAECLGDVYFSLSVDDESIHIRVYDKEINHKLMGASYHDDKYDPEWKEVCNVVNGWLADYEED